MRCWPPEKVEKRVGIEIWEIPGIPDEGERQRMALAQNVEQSVMTPTKGACSVVSSTRVKPVGIISLKGVSSDKLETCGLEIA